MGGFGECVPGLLAGPAAAMQPEMLCQYLLAVKRVIDECTTQLDDLRLHFTAGLPSPDPASACAPLAAGQAGLVAAPLDLAAAPLDLAV